MRERDGDTGGVQQPNCPLQNSSKVWITNPNSQTNSRPSLRPHPVVITHLIQRVIKLLLEKHGLLARQSTRLLSVLFIDKKVLP